MALLAEIPVSASDYALYRWPHDHPRPDPETTRHNASMVRQFAVDFAGRSFGSITVAEARAWAQDNAGAVRYVRTMLNDAIEDGLVEVNVFAGLKAPAVPSRRQVEVPSRADVEALILAGEACDASGWLGGMVAAAAFMGPRLSELLALEGSDVSASDGLVRVVRQLGRNGKAKPLKKAGADVVEREIVVPERVLKRLWVRLGDPLAGRIFPVSHRQHRTAWEEARRRAKRPHIEFHQLRTFCASWLLDEGASPIDVAVQLHGHTNPKTVLRYYAMIDRGRALERIRKVMEGGA